ncbi:chemotaxis protein CheW [Crocosphaera chwakensis]|uniref:Purine-binding chemotaxis protein n=1 Tax=Crocosphaera chwakensis CCY0110 TaxID=391612 RepID=A3ISZ4_9CHRO|nr:chemotaxis protein CheW [Crocosphaera chwakensis]EAZ90425.1 purine-binding chemotaxis protein [Crocosphaera chwakensis CCY0110]
MNTNFPLNRHYKFLCFHLTPEIQAMLSTNMIREIIKIAPNHIVPIYGVLSSVMGVYHRRGEVLWVVDLACLFTLSPFLQESYHNPYSIIVMRQDNKVIGLAVRQIGQLISYADLKPPEVLIKSIPWELAYCLNSEHQGKEKQLFLQLEGEKIFDLLKKKQLSY